VEIKVKLIAKKAMLAIIMMDIQSSSRARQRIFKRLAMLETSRLCDCQMWPG